MGIVTVCDGCCYCYGDGATAYTEEAASGMPALGAKDVLVGATAASKLFACASAATAVLSVTATYMFVSTG